MKSIFTLVFLHLSLFVFAQDSSFQLKDYKYRTPGYRALSVSFRLSGSHHETKTLYDEERTSGYFDLGPFYVSYNKLISTENRQHQSTISLQPDASFSRNTYNGKESHSNRITPSFSWNRSDRFYRTQKSFFEVGNQFSVGYTGQNISDTTYSYKSKNLNVQDQLFFGVGKGRIENVQDAQTALYLLQDLSRQNLLSRTPTAEEANRLAQLITSINNRRVFDLRRRRIYELTQLDSFFRSSGLAPQTDIRHFTTINDNWALALSPGRLSGSNWYLRLAPTLQFQRATNTDLFPLNSIYKMQTTMWTMSPVVGYENDRPLSLRWQRNVAVSLAYVRARSNETTKLSRPGSVTNTENTVKNWYSSLYAVYGIGYFPNNRSSVTASVNVLGNFYKENSLILYSQFNLAAQYFIGYQTYLTATAYTNYDYTNGKFDTRRLKSHDFSTGLSVTLSHILF